MQSGSRARGPGIHGWRGSFGERWIVHSMQSWLALSEQFVHALVAGSRHPGVVVARERLVNTDVFPYRPVRSLRLVPRKAGYRTERRLVTAGLLALTAPYRPALVHHHHGYRAVDPLGLVLRRKLPFVLSLHGEDVTTHVRRWPGDVVPALDVADAVIVPSRFLLERAIGIGAREESLVVIPSGVNTSFFTPTPLAAGPPEALFVGRFVEKKGVDILLAAWPRVRQRVPTATLRLLGYGPMEDLAYSAPPGVVVEPPRPQQRAAQVRDAMRRARLVVTPSRTARDGDSESLLLVNLEAQASGRPVVTTRHGGIPEFVDEGTTALLVPEADPEALAEAMILVLSDDDLAHGLADAGPKVAARFEMSACTARVDDLYDRLIRETA